MSRLAPTPKHLWIIGILAVLWNLMGVYDYLMTQTENEAYLAKFDQAQLDYFYSFPIWVEVFWALAIWGAMAGCVLLLMRKRLAVPVFLGSLVSMVITAVYNFGLSRGMEVMGAGGLIFTIAIFFIALGLWLYSKAMAARNVLG